MYQNLGTFPSLVLHVESGTLQTRFSELFSNSRNSRVINGPVNIRALKLLLKKATGPTTGYRTLIDSTTFVVTPLESTA
jgi:hypothetical protein